MWSEKVKHISRWHISALNGCANDDFCTLMIHKCSPHRIQSARIVYFSSISIWDSIHLRVCFHSHRMCAKHVAHFLRLRSTLLNSFGNSLTKFPISADFPYSSYTIYSYMKYIASNPTSQSRCPTRRDFAFARCFATAKTSPKIHTNTQCGCGARFQRAQVESVDVAAARTELSGTRLMAEQAALFECDERKLLNYNINEMIS